MEQVILWINADTIHWRIYTALVGAVLINAVNDPL